MDNLKTSNQKKHTPSVHSGHRERLRKRFKYNQGADFSDHELLEMALFYALPRVNTNDLAHKLLNEFGSLRNLYNAEPGRISRVAGAGEATATYIALTFAIRKRIELEKYNTKSFKADTLSAVGNYLVDYYRDKPCEEACAMLLDESFRMIDFVTLSKGTVNSTALDIKTLVRHALLANASNIILSHNHPSGEASPSSYDRNLTVQLEAALRTVQINLVEHIIVNDISYTPTMYMKTTDPLKLQNAEKYRHFYNN